MAILYKNDTTHEKLYNHLRSVWTLRTLLYTDAHIEFLDRRCFDDSQIMRSIGMEVFNRKEMSDKKILRALETWLKELEKSGSVPKESTCCLLRNIENLGQRLHLNACEKKDTFLLRNEQE